MVKPRSNQKSNATSRSSKSSSSSLRTPPDSPIPSTSSLNVPRTPPKRKNANISKRANDSHYSSPLKQAELNKLVHECIYYILIEEQKKIPIKRQDLVKHVFDKSTKLRHKYTAVIENVREYLKKVFGMDIANVPDRKPEQFIVVNLVRDPDIPVEYTQMQNAQQGLLMVVLSIIFMNNGIISEDDLWKALKVLGLNPDAKIPHSVLGDVKKLLTQEWVRQLYIKYELLPNSEPPLYQFQWGFRAEREVNKRNVLEFVSKIYGNEPQNWNSQYRLTQSEGFELSEAEDEEETEG